MSDRGQWLLNLGVAPVDGLVSVDGYRKSGRPPEEVAMMEKAEDYGATAVFFEAGRDGRPPVAQAFIYVSDGPVRDQGFADLHRRLWSWGGVPLVYRVTSGLVQLFRCAHKAEFESRGEIVFKPFKTLKLATKIADDPWWDADRLRNGTLWDDPAVCKSLLSGAQAAQKTLIKEVKLLHDDLDREGVLPKTLRRKLLILSLLIAYLEARKVFEADYFARFRTGATKFFEVLADGPALIDLLDHLESRFNGHVFTLGEEDRRTLRGSRQLARFARLIEGKQEAGGQLTLWQRYSFADLPVELISHIYQLFVTDAAVAVYTPHFLVRLMLGEVLSWKRLERLQQEDEVILDPCCGSGVFLVEAYKRLVLHWRSRNEWKRPGKADLQKLVTRVHGIDLEKGAVELAAFSLCLALCDALKPEEIRASIKLFPELKERSIHTGCFFEAREQAKVKEKVGVVVGNPPFSSSLGTEAAKRAYERYQKGHGALPDKQLAYLFLHGSMEMLAEGGVLSMLQQYNFLYNQQSLGFRRKFIDRWDVREILDFISVRGLFQKGGADTKVVVVVAEAAKPQPKGQILHATFRRSGRADAEQGFDIDYYDMHWLPRDLVLTNDGVWRANLVGGGRVLGFVDRLKKLRTLGQYADEQGWEVGQGFFFGSQGTKRSGQFLWGKPCLNQETLGPNGIEAKSFAVVPERPIERPRSPSLYEPPLLLVRLQMDLHQDLWIKHFLAFQCEVFGMAAPAPHIAELQSIRYWIEQTKPVLKALVAATSPRLFVRKATSCASDDVRALPYPANRTLDISPHEQILVDDIVDYYRDLIRLGEDSAAMREDGVHALPGYNDIYMQQINAIYTKNELRALEPQTWPGVICQPFVFGEGKVDCKGAEGLRGRLDTLLREQRGSGLTITRIARVYDGPCIYLLKPDRLRYWLRSVALRDADETLADLWDQGF
ncbi:MAG: N-6 DNA methylase [Sedimentisphaerales bacterium]|nr:N-6 DNA methylase [Sedimentisphaerales bacterium]